MADAEKPKQEGVTEPAAASGGPVTANEQQTVPPRATSQVTFNENNQAVIDANTAVVQEFQYLLEKSQQLFAGLRDLPPIGRNWQPYFQKTFEVYTKLWKYQQHHRAVLENKTHYGMKRWEIGEVASKIGQLYYHYYLRTSETSYLNEAFVFYEAIRERQYFKDILDAKSPALMIKKLRYYARFIVICLLLNRNDLIKTLMDELTSLVEQYTNQFKPNDSAEWNIVLSEISTFLEAEKKLAPTTLEGNVLQFPSRLQIKSSPKTDQDGNVQMRLQEAILVGNYQNQIKFSELTLDMYRILQSLEREPIPAGSAAQKSNQDAAATSEDKAAGEGNDEKAKAEAAKSKSSSRRNNPHKYLLYRPNIAQLMLYLSTASKDVAENCAMLVYISADGSKRAIKGEGQQAESLSGGVATAINHSRKSNEKLDMDQINAINCLYPHDLIPFTRKPLFVVIDSTNSLAFKDCKRYFMQPVVFLLSPTEYPAPIRDSSQIGSLFTLFLHSPLKAFAFISDITESSSETWHQCLVHMNSLENTIMEVLQQTTDLDPAYTTFCQDDFLRFFVLRYVICDLILSAHSSFTEPKHLPYCHPAMPASLKTNEKIIAELKELTTIVGLTNMYNFDHEVKVEASS